MTKKINIPVLITILLLAVSIGISLFYSFSSDVDVSLQNEEILDNRREEILRYIGYENLLARYITLPYDVTINTNQRGSFVDIGFIFLLMIPLLFLWFVRKSLWKTISSIILFALFLSLCLQNSFILVGSNKIAVNQDISMADVGTLTWDQSILFGVYKVSSFIYGIISPIFDAISNDKDYVTYPILIGIFFLLAFSIYQLFKSHRRKTYLTIYFTLSYGFFFFVFSAGIVWYGYLFFLLALLLIAYFTESVSKEDNFFSHYIRGAFIVVALIWAVTGIIARMSNIQPGVPTEHLGKAIIPPDVYKYNLGHANTKGDLLKTTSPSLGAALDEINRNKDKLVYKVGTGLTYFIENNHTRVLTDNQLGTFFALLQREKDKYVISDIFKVNQIKYLIVDLNTASIDNTPERTLTQKFIALMQYIENNESLRLLSTDRLVENPANPGSNDYIYNMAGKVVKPGSYAIYEIN